MRCIPEAIGGVGNQRNWKENQDMPIQDFSLTSPAIWLWNIENHKDWTVSKAKANAQDRY